MLNHTIKEPCHLLNYLKKGLKSGSHEMIDLIDALKLISGHPIPDLTWWLGGNLIDSQYYLAHKDTVINDLENFKVLR